MVTLSGSAGALDLPAPERPLESPEPRERSRTGRAPAMVPAFGLHAPQWRAPDEAIGCARAVVMRALDAPVGAVSELRDRAARIVVVSGLGAPCLEPGSSMRVWAGPDSAHHRQSVVAVQDWSAQRRSATTSPCSGAGASSPIGAGSGVGGRGRGRPAVIVAGPRPSADPEADVAQAIAYLISTAPPWQQTGSAPGELAAFARFAPGWGDLAVPAVLGLLLGLDADERGERAGDVLPAGGWVLVMADDPVGQCPGAVHHGRPAFGRDAAAADRAVDTLRPTLIGAPGRVRAQHDDATRPMVRLTRRTAATPRAIEPGDAGAGGAGDAVTVEVTLPPVPASASAARGFVHRVTARWGLTALEEATTLITSELVTNAVLHVAGPITLTLRRTATARLWIGVQDDSDHPVRPRRPDASDVSGRGLPIVEIVASRWGVHALPTGKIVWAEVGSEAGPQDDPGSGPGAR